MPKTTVEIFKYHLSTSNIRRLLEINVMWNSMSCCSAALEETYLFGSCCVTYSLNIFFCANENLYSKTNWKIMFYENNSRRRAVTKAKIVVIKNLKKTTTYI